jgi:phage FluMu gp28-like protein
MDCKPILYPYQQRWVADTARFKIGMWSRQTGKSFATSLEAVLDAVENRSLWVLLSRGERQSRELMEKVRLHAGFLGAAVQAVEADWGKQTSVRLMECRFPGGGRVIGLPANPDTARGFSGNVVLDEFAFHADSRKIWTALYPSITRGYKIRVISTPNGRSGMFYDLWSADNGYAKHKVAIDDAVAQGLPLNVAELRAGINDPDAWAQEYECQFIDEAAALITFEMIAACESDCLAAPEELAGLTDLYIGMDIGRRRDLTVIWLAQRLGDVLVSRAVQPMFRAPFAAQMQALSAWLALPGLRRACIDATGLGMQLAEEAQSRFGACKVEAVTFTAAVKEELAMTMLRRFQDRAVRVPADAAIRSELHAIRKVVTAAGNVRYDADRSETAGHADHFWALALAIHAASNPSGPIEFESTGQRRAFTRTEAYVNG